MLKHQFAFAQRCKTSYPCKDSGTRKIIGLLNDATAVDTAQTIVDGWKRWLDWDMELVMRDTPDRERVKLVNVLPDGRVEVVDVKNNHDNPTARTLVSDYFL